MQLLDIARKGRASVVHTVGPDGTAPRALRNYAGRVPTQTFLWAALGSIAGSLVLQSMKKREMSLFVGQWAPTFLALGLYHKLTKPGRAIFGR
jgi:hypothetical protein